MMEVENTTVTGWGKTFTKSFEGGESDMNYSAEYLEARTEELKGMLSDIDFDLNCAIQDNRYYDEMKLRIEYKVIEGRLDELKEYIEATK